MNYFSTVLCVLALSAYSNAAKLYLPKLNKNLKAEWSYDPNDPHGPDNWGGICNDGSKQSPIDIDLEDIIISNLPNIELSNTYDVLPESMSVVNNGHTIQLSAQLAEPLTISGGPLNGSYTFVQFHFHWGSENNLGSEHTISNLSFPMEMHAVHRNENANPNDNTISVIGYFFQVSSDDNPVITKILEAIEANPEENIEIPVATFKLNEIIKPFTLFMTYTGSLTTPPCTESVQWVLPFSNILPLSQAQLDKFRKIANETPTLKNNYRPVQPLNGRKVGVKLNPF